MEILYLPPAEKHSGGNLRPRCTREAKLPALLCTVSVSNKVEQEHDSGLQGAAASTEDLGTSQVCVQFGKCELQGTGK